MNILSKVTWKAMWKNKTRTIVTIIGIILSAAMFMAVVTLAFSLRDFMLRGTYYEQGDYYVRFSGTSQEQLEALKADERVSSVVNVQVHGFFSATYPGEDPGYTNTFLLGSADQGYFDTMPVRLLKGRLPENSGELVVSEYILTRLEKGGHGTELGDTVELTVLTAPEYFTDQGLPLPENSEYTISYTIVGVIEDLPNITNLMVEAALTLADDNVPETLFNQSYAKTYDPADAYNVVSGGYGTVTAVNDDLLMLNGVTAYSNLNNILIGICAVLIAIIMVGSVSLIYNAFSISVSERTKQFGLLSSVGATKKQIRRSVFFEAGALCAFGIPLGIFFGWAGIAVVLYLLEDIIVEMFNYGGDIPLYAVASGVGIACAAVIGVITVFISAAIPSARATKVSPVAAIRQSEDYKTGKKAVKVGKLTYKLFGLPGAMAKKYYSISRKKYRSTVISLSISVVLFICAATISGGLRTTASENARVHNYDMVCSGLSEEWIEKLRELAQMEEVEEAVWLGYSSYNTVLPLADVEDDFILYHSYHYTESIFEDRGYATPAVSIAFVEDSKLRAWLEDHNIDPEPYLNAEDPLALVVEQNGTIYDTNEKGETSRYILSSYGVKDGVTELALYSRNLDWLQVDGYEMSCSLYTVTPDGRMCIHVVPWDVYMEYPDPEALNDDTSVGLFFVLEQGDSETCYYAYDPETDTTAAEPSGTVPTVRTSVKLGARVEDTGLTNQTNDLYNIRLVLPLSSKQEEGGLYLALNLKNGGAEAVRAFIAENDVVCNDYLADEQQMRGVLMVIDVFSYGFIILISLICVANVFNTISTNIALRRRDFGMLRSTGMQTGELYRMMNYECLIYGSKALLWGLPVSVVLSYGIWRITATDFSDPFTPPWSAMLVAAACVFLVVFISMFYAVTKLRKDNPIEAIRMENL